MALGDGRLDKEDVEKTLKVVTSLCLFIPKLIAMVRDFLGNANQKELQ